ncbi:hypothetical protein J2T57_001231 [Natronocella acetinitrilica]|uniref:DUF4326 domain-containing protein n=1 Tax=Natronocella acetinitrilica TaxID=414046 RepID=A0AAE3G319_9GAMM|nr:DUF4326 domain-containing protein [Natronocella acetinitrilica]MCP1674129.1 hypothetical protein [Natronocella acetinitrilica]
MGGSVRVGNRHRGDVGDYIGRPGALGNPFVIGRDGCRSAVIWRYAEWLEAAVTRPGPVRSAMVGLFRRLRAGEDLVLVCHCHPRPCHGDVIAAFLRRHLPGAPAGSGTRLEPPAEQKNPGSLRPPET